MERKKRISPKKKSLKITIGTYVTDNKMAESSIVAVSIDGILVQSYRKYRVYEGITLKRREIRPTAGGNEYALYTGRGELVVTNIREHERQPHEVDDVVFREFAFRLIQRAAIASKEKITFCVKPPSSTNDKLDTLSSY